MKLACAALLACAACGGSAALEASADDLTALAWDGAVHPLFGAATGAPVVTSNNPEAFSGEGLLLGTGPEATRRGGHALALRGDFGIYLHHLNRSGAATVISVVVRNAAPATVQVSARGAGYSQDETGGVALGASPDFNVSRDVLLGALRGPGSLPLAPGASAVLWSRPLGNEREIDARLFVSASGPVFISILAGHALADAPGDIRAPGPGRLGREAGVYAHDRWTGASRLTVPPRGSIRFSLDDLAQAPPALMALADSAQRAVGMYGDRFDLSFALTAAGPRRVRVWFDSLAAGQASRDWDGMGLFDAAPVVLRHTPSMRRNLLGEVPVRTIEFSATVPGLASIPQALTLESF